jgi:type I thyroxine 5'-deiodinase
MKSNDKEGVEVARHRSFEERSAAAAQLCSSRQIEIPVLLDLMDDAVAEAYSAFPDRLYIIDRYGRIAYKGGRGPVGFDPEGMERALMLVLLEERLKLF